MNEKPVFYEKQSFRQWWLWLLLSASMIFTIYTIIEDREDFSTIGFIISITIPISIILLFFTIRLETKIDELGIRVRLFPFHLRFKYFPWKTIKEAYIREYSPIGEYGGWGLRIGLFGEGKAYNVSGNIGLQLVFNDNKKLLIGTQKSEEIKFFLEEINKI